jgi:hypothetical protein
LGLLVIPLFREELDGLDLAYAMLYAGEGICVASFSVEEQRRLTKINSYETWSWDR